MLQDPHYLMDEYTEMHRQVIETSCSIAAYKENGFQTG